jgi:phosphatidylglycerophosphate synthase
VSRVGESQDGIATLGREVAEDALRLVRAEIELAKSQMKATLLRALLAIILISLAALLLLIAVVEALGALPSEFGPRLFGNRWLGWLALGGVLLLLSLGAAGLGTIAVRRSLRQGRQAVSALKEDTEWLRQLRKRGSSGS